MLLLTFPDLETVSVNTVREAMRDALNYRKKHVSLVNPAQSQPGHLKLRLYCLTKIFATIHTDQVIISVDETSAFSSNRDQLRWTVRGVRRVVDKNCRPRENLTLLAAITSDGSVHVVFIQGACKSVHFAYFMVKLAEMYATRNYVILMDNAAIHYSSILKATIVSNRIRVQAMPPYTPELNPVENFFGHLKKKAAPLFEYNNIQLSSKRLLEKIAATDSSIIKNLFRGMIRRNCEYFFNR